MISSNHNYRVWIGTVIFKFSYQINLAKSANKVQLWFPSPQSNETQLISNENLNHGVLECEKLIEPIHGNNYYYCYSDNGLEKSLDMIFNFRRSLRKDII